MNGSSWLDAGGDLRDEDPRPDPARMVQTPVQHLDLDTVLKVLEVLSDETDLERLIGTVTRLCLEHAGAERGLLILPRDDAFRIEAEAEVSSDAVRVARRQSVVSAQGLPESVFHYVSAREITSFCMTLWRSTRSPTTSTCAGTTYAQCSACRCSSRRRWSD